MNTRWVGLAGLGGAAALAVTLVYLYIWHDDSVTITELDVAQARLKLQGAASAPKTTPARPLDRKARVRLAIGSLGLALDEENRRLSDMLVAELTGTEGLDLVDRASFEKVLKELEFSAAGIGQAKDAVRIGRLLKADWFLLGTSTALTNRPNAVVARIVDVQTSIMRDVALIENDGNPATLAARLTGFARDCLKNSGDTPGRVYLAVGSFQDLSMNNRQEKFLPELHAFLTSAYRGTKVTLVEREFVNALLNEVRLDLAGLTEGADGPASPRMHSAFWLVDGFYQSFETTTLQVEVELNVKRVFGNNTRVILKEPSLEAVLQKIKQTVDEVVGNAPALLAPTRNSELRLQLATGRELSKFDPWMIGWSAPPYEDLDAAQLARRKRNLEEAIRTFETVLLFEPTNREAKVYLGTLVRRYPLLRNEEGWDYYRQVIDEPVDDMWANRAQNALRIALTSVPAHERARWYRTAAARPGNPKAAAFYLANAQSVETDLAVQKQSGSRSGNIAEQKLFTDMDTWVGQMRKGWGGSAYAPLYLFARSFGTNQAAAAEAMAELVPKLKEKYPEYQEYILAGVLSYQVTTNSPIVEEFENSFDQAVLNPQKLIRPKEYFSDINEHALGWCAKAGLARLTTKIIIGTQQSAEKGFAEKLEDVQKLTLALAYMRLERWREALDILEAYKNCPVYVGSGWWGGPSWTVVQPSKYVTRCREKLGLPALLDPREFQVGKAVLCLHTGQGHLGFGDRSWVVASDASGLWIGAEDRLLHLDFDLRTNLSFILPAGEDPTATCLCTSPTNLWIGTAGAGVFDFDPFTKRCQRYTEAHGLLMNSIGALSLCDDKLWIGYQQETGGAGGLGQLDLRTRKFISYSGSVTARSDISPRFPFGSESGDQPTRQGVNAMIALASGDVWLVTPTAMRPTLRRFRPKENVWEGTTEVRRCISIAATETHLFAGEYQGLSPGIRGLPKAPPDHSLGVRLRNLESGQWRSLTAATNLPPAQVTALLANGDDLWVGGVGYIARYNSKDDTLRAFCYVPADFVRGLQVGGGYLWAHFDRHLYRVALSEVR